MKKQGEPVPNVTKDPLKSQEKHPAMYAVATRLPVERRIPVSPVDRDIRDFLSGKNDGEDLLHALYDHVLDEPVPERLRAVLRG